jgi:nucleotide-binding universal stress UspA family protein
MMMRELNKILAATDGSEHGLAAVVTGAMLAERAGAGFEVATVLEILLLPPPYTLPGPDAAEFELEFMREARVKAIEQARQGGAGDAPIHVRAGLAPQLVNKVAQESSSDLIVVGANPQPALARSLVGPTGRRIVYLADRPVLVASEARRAPYRRIVAAVDLSQTSLAVLECAWTLAKVDGAELRVLFVLEPLPMMLARVARLREEGLRKASSELDRVLSEADLSTESSVVKRIREGNAGREILQEAQSADADLVVMGTHGFGFFDRLMLGSTSLYVLRHGNRALLVVPGTESRD